MISLGAILIDAQVPTTTKATAPALNLVLGDEDQSVRVAVWQNHAAQIGDPKPHIGKGIVLTSLRVAKRKEGSTELGTSRQTQLLTAPPAMADQLKDRTKKEEELVSMSTVYGGGRTDYSGATTTKIHLAALTSFIVPNQVRDLAEEIYEVFHCLIEDVVPLPDADRIYYMCCPTCKKAVCTWNGSYSKLSC